MACQWVQNSTIDQRIDDDAETDDDVFKNAIRQVFADVEQAEIVLSGKPRRKVINNVNIKARVAYPDNYDRDGQPIRNNRRYRSTSL